MSTLSRALSLLALALLVVIIPVVAVSNYRLGVLALVASYAVASLAQNLLSGYVGIPSLGNVAFFATSAYVTAILATQARLPAGIAMIVGIGAAAALGLIVGLPALRISGMHLAIVTVALVFAVQEILEQWDAGQQSNGISIGSPNWLLQDRGLYVAAVLAALICYLAIWNLLHSRSGRAMVATSTNPFAAASAGIDSVRYRLLAFVVSGAVTGVAGVIYLYYAGTVTPQAFPLDLSLAFLTMTILGGSRSLGGSLLGALIVGLLPEALAYLPSHIDRIDVQQSVAGLYALLLLVCLRFFPDGIWNAAAAGAERVRQARQFGSTEL